MKIEKPEILVYSTIPLSSRFQRSSYFGEYYEFEDVKKKIAKKSRLLFLPKNYVFRQQIAGAALP